MWWKTSQCLMLSACLLAACDKESDSSSPAPETLTAPTDILAVPHPTTQQLLNAPRTALELKFAPVTLQVPPGWEVKSYNEGTLVTVEGSTPTDVIGISVPVSRTITADQEFALEAQAAHDLKQHPDLLHKLGVREITGGKVIEHLIVDPPLPTAQPGQPATQPIQTMQWTFSVCIPTADGKEYTVYDLKFLGMTLAQYKADQAFLRPIIDSLTYTPSTELPPT
jgi:hypothetical protein